MALARFPGRSPVKGAFLFSVQLTLRLAAVKKQQSQRLRNIRFLQNCQRLGPGAFQNRHGLPVIFRGFPAGILLRHIAALFIQNPPGRLRAAKFQPQLHKISIVVGQPGKLAAGLAQRTLPQLCLNPA